MFPYKWKLADGYPAKGIDYHGTKVMTTFACGGGSTMGYKLAGYDVVAANDIDPQMARVYETNHHPKQFFLCGIDELMKRNDLPEVDLLDGSPPCSVFSMSGSREGAWQKDKVFREGQAKQILDDLFFDFIDLVEKMQPKFVIAENVKGMLVGHAKWYTREIVRRFRLIGYECQVFLCNAATMGVPQRRERVFFIAHKTDKTVNLKFNEKPILFRDIKTGENTRPVTAPSYLKVWEKRKYGDKSFAYTNKREFNRPNSLFNLSYIYENNVLPTISAADRNILFDESRYINKTELCLAGSFPLDYDFGKVKPEYLIGMSVPPVMMAQVAHQVYEQLIKSGKTQVVANAIP